MRHAVLWLALTPILGCADFSAPPMTHADATSAPMEPDNGPAGGLDSYRGDQDLTDAAEPEADGRRQQPGFAPKLIRTGEVSVVVDVFEPFEAALLSWLTDAGGYVADATLTHHEGDVSRARLTLRVPADHFDALVGWTEERVSTQSVSVHTADVTADWVDVAARIENAKREEARLHTLLDEQTGTLADVLAVERELSRVRGEIERAEGRMRVLSDQVAMSTLTLEVMVRAPYETYVSETFGHQAARVFTSSLDVMGATARGLALAVIAMIPWLVVLGAGLAALIAVFRRMSQRRR